MPKLLKNLKVTEVSILTGTMNPANGESVVVKADNSFEIVAKADRCIDGLIYCTIIKDAFDSDDEKPADKKTIQKAAHDFLKNSRSIDENHTHKSLDGVHVVESHIDENGDWKAVFDVSDNADMLAKAKKGEINGVSIYGKAEKVEKAGKEFNADNTGMLKQIMDWLKSKFESENKSENIKKSEGQEMTKDEFKAMLGEIEAEKKNADQTNAAAVEMETLKSSVKALETLTKSQSETIEKQAKTIEEIAKHRTTDTGTGDGKVTLETIAKCADSAKRKEMLQTYSEQLREGK